MKFNNPQEKRRTRTKNRKDGYTHERTDIAEESGERSGRMKETRNRQISAVEPRRDPDTGSEKERKRK